MDLNLQADVNMRVQDNIRSPRFAAGLCIVTMVMVPLVLVVKIFT